MAGIAVVALFAGCSSTGTDKQFEAFDVCTTFVKRQLLSESSAEFPDPTEDDGEVRISHSGDVWTVRSKVDAENGFGAKLTRSFVCRVKPVGDQWQNLGTEIEGS